MFQLRITLAAGNHGHEGNHPSGLGNHPGIPSRLGRCLRRIQGTVGRLTDRYCPRSYCRRARPAQRRRPRAGRSCGDESRVSAPSDSLCPAILSDLNLVESASALLAMSRGPGCRSDQPSKAGCLEFPLPAYPGRSVPTGFRWMDLPAGPGPPLGQRQGALCRGSRQDAPTSRRPARGWETLGLNGPMGPDSRAGG